MTRSLRPRLLAAEGQLLTSFIAGRDAMSTFGKTWRGILDDLPQAITDEEDEQDTRALAQATASRIAVIADALLSLDIQAGDLKTLLHTDVCKILEAEYHQSDTPPSLDAVAANWLFSNIHNPYPSSDMKTSIARSCGVSLQVVQDWFSHARHSIGWTTLLQERFAGSRRAILDAASSAYRHAGQGEVLNDLLPGILRAFATIKENAQSLCPDAATTPEVRDTVRIEPSTETIVRQESEPLDVWFKNRANSPESVDQFSLHDDGHIPSFPDCSSHAAMSPVDEDIEEDITSPPPIAGRKRRFEASFEAVDGVQQTSFPSKRCRSAATPCIDDQRLPGHDQTWCLAPPRSSLHLAKSVEGTRLCDLAPSPPTSSRKRRLSDPGTCSTSKRPRVLIPAPRKQTVSQPLPMNSDQNNWEMFATREGLDTTCEVLDPTTIEAHGSNLPLDVEFVGFAGSPSQLPLNGPSSNLDASDADLAFAMFENFDFSAWEFPDAVTTSISDSSPTSVYGTAGDSSASSSSSSPFSGTLSELSDYWSPNDLANEQSILDWSNFILPSFGASPTSSQSSLQGLSPIPQSRPDSASPSGTGNISHAINGVDPSFNSSDLLSDMGEFSSLLMPLGAVA